MNPIIETHQLTKIYAPPQGWRRVARQTPVTAVADMTLTVPPGELFGLLGPNGAGKTTLTKMLCTLIMPSSGLGRVVGHDLHDTLAIRAAVGLVVSDERSFFWRLSARRNLNFFAAMHGLHGR
ncbi:MAG: ATP-binding cassette domain-containing protein, partial [Chloroflexi bacterium]|nr:ATP-binding cassette domain-containing protein [Chloroflexota bacterium]